MKLPPPWYTSCSKRFVFLSECLVSDLPNFSRMTMANPGVRGTFKLISQPDAENLGQTTAWPLVKLNKWLEGQNPLGLDVMFGPFGQGSQGTHAIVADWRENCEGGDHHLHPNPLLGWLEPSRLLDTKEGWQDLQQRRSPGGLDNHRHITRFHKSSPPPWCQIIAHNKY